MSWAGCGAPRGIRVGAGAGAGSRSRSGAGPSKDCRDVLAGCTGLIGGAWPRLWSDARGVWSGAGAKLEGRDYEASGLTGIMSTPGEEEGEQAGERVQSK